MRKKRGIVIFFVLIMAGCGAPRELAVFKERAETAAEAGDYARAVKAWQAYFDEQAEAETEVTGAVFARAAKTAYQAGKADLAVRWYDQARYREYGSREMYRVLSEIFRKKDNLSKELTALEYLYSHGGASDARVTKRLFEIYYAIDMEEKALDVWAHIPPGEQGKESLLEKYFFLHQEQENEAVCDSLSRELLELNPRHAAALEWNAKKYFWQGENRYKREMEAYENNKTTRQYRLLLKELEKSTRDYKKALGFFEKLWEVKPSERERYASYLATIFARFGDQEKADHYKKFLN